MYSYIYIYTIILMYILTSIHIQEQQHMYVNAKLHIITCMYTYCYQRYAHICLHIIYYIYNILIFTFPSEFRPTEPGREHCTPAHNTCCDSFAEFGALEISTTRRTSLLDCKGRTCGFHGAFKHHRNAGFHVVLSCHFQSLWGTYKATWLNLLLFFRWVETTRHISNLPTLVTRGLWTSSEMVVSSISGTPKSCILIGHGFSINYI